MSETAAVTVRRTSYPQVDPRAAGLMHRALVVVPSDATVAVAIRLADRRQARHVVARVGRTWAVAPRHTLTRALGLGLDRVPVAAVLWDAPLVALTAPEVVVRRQLRTGQPFVLVGGSGGPEGIVLRDKAVPGSLPRSLTPELRGLPEPVGEILREAGRLGDARGFTVAAVGGLVRDLLLKRVGEQVDLDLVVEGDGIALAHDLASRLGGQTMTHTAFLTATVILADGRRIDLATARRESYPAPGALPSVAPATLIEDLGRRDFSVNALAVRLDGAAVGQLVDPTGGLADLETRRIRVLHALSFVEDPTRILRAARFAARLGCRVDPTTRRLASHAARLSVYRALSGDRLRAELERMLVERRPVAALREASQLGAWSLIGSQAPPRRRASRLLTAALAPRALGSLGRDTSFGLTLLALAEGSPAVDTWIDRLALAPGRRDAVRRARRDAPRLVAHLRRVRHRVGTYSILEGVPELTLAWARVLARGAARRHLDRYLRHGRGVPTLATGDDVAALGVPPGPAMGELLRALRVAQAAGQVRSRTGALRWLAGAMARSLERGDVSLTRQGRKGG
jgi:tRNA nucleotidyltransferase (CCA-adding enzyme)